MSGIHFFKNVLYLKNDDDVGYVGHGLIIREKD